MLGDLEDVVILTRKKNPHHWHGGFRHCKAPKVWYYLLVWYGTTTPTTENGLTYDITSSFFTL